MQNQLHLFNKRRFWPLFVAQFTGAFNDNFYKQGLVFLLTYGALVTSSQSGYWINIASSLFILPFFLFSAISGELADKFEKTKFLVWVKAIELGLVLFIAYGLYTQSLTCLLSAIFFFGLHATVFGPAKYAVLPELLKEDELIAGNAFLESSTFVAILLGMMMSYLITHASYGLPFAILTMLIVAGAGLLSALWIPKSKIEHPKHHINWNFILATRDVLEYAQKNRTVWLSILGISWFWLVGYVLIIQFPIFVRDYMNASSIIVNFCLGMFTIGFISGALLCNKILHSRIEATYVPLGAIGLSIFLIDLYFASRQVGSISSLESFLQFETIRFGVDLAMTAFCGGILSIPLYTFLQTKSDPEHRSRVIASNNIMNSLFMLLGSALVYVLNAIHLQIPQIFLVLGILNLGVAFYTCKLLPDALVRSLLRTVLKRLYHVEVKNIEAYPPEDMNYIIIANHTSYLDILLICAFLPDSFSIAVNTEVAKAWWIKPFLMLADHFPIDPTKPMATRTIIEKVRAGKKCVIFPEGRLTTTGALMKIYEGPGLIAERAKAKIVPIRIEGAQYAYPFSRLSDKVRTRFFPRITITVMPHMDLSQEASIEDNRVKRRQYSIRLYRLMREMMFNSSEYETTLFHSLLGTLSIHGGKCIIAEDIERKPINLKNFILRSVILGSYIKKHSRSGDKIGLMIPNTNTAMIAFFALQYTGRVPAMINFTTGASNIIHGCKVAGVKEIYTSRRFVETTKLHTVLWKIQEAGIKVHYLEDLREDITTRHKLMGYLRYLNLERNYRKKSENIDPCDPAVILFTSGSEGRPKAVALSHRNILSNCQQLRSSIDFTQKDVVFNSLPVFHSFGLTVGSILPILSGIKTFFYPSPLHYRVIPELVYDSNATLLFGTDTFLTGYAKYAHNYDFYNIRYIFAGAEKLKPETYRIWAEKFGTRIFEGYGATEAAPVLACNTPMESQLGTVGRFLPGIEYRLETVDGYNNGKRLYVKGPNVMLGYYQDEHNLNQPIDGWYDTGDVVSIDDDGYITIQDRAKRFAKIGGEMVSLTAVEHIVSDIWPGHMHACGIIPDPRKGEQIILLTTRENPTQLELNRGFKERGYGEIYIPRDVIFVEGIPVLGSGKINYAEVNALVRELKNLPAKSA